MSDRDGLNWWRDKAMQLEAELADLRASSVVVVRERCQQCQGRGYEFIVGVKHECRELCDNGWRLAEGVEHVVYSNEGPYYLVPARLIEGEA